ncbi:DUF1801 domain-containing protein [Kineococcus sp. SYSU DK006]|uniref:DUF1801 domain-containing protein n=1 Tax=Kineococcus sp. SYSU DK006 TaxID=3383127 RepID=UPI003D7CB61E
MGSVSGSAGADTDTGTEFSERERASMKERASELKKQGRRSRAADKAGQDLADVLAKIAQMPDADRALAQRVHEVVTAAAPDLAPKLYYGQPGYAREGKIVCFFRSGQVDGLRYSTFGFSPQADLDEARGLWATSYAVTNQADDEALRRIAELVEKATGETAPTSRAGD